MATKDAIRQTLIELMEKNKTTGSELAEAVGVTKQAVSAWRTGKSSIDIENVPAICDFFGITIGDFFAKAEENNPDDDYRSEEILLSPDERELVLMYRNVTKYQKPGVLFILAMMQGNDWVEPTVHYYGTGNHPSLEEVYNTGYLPYPVHCRGAIEEGKKWAQGIL